MIAHDWLGRPPIPGLQPGARMRYRHRTRPEGERVYGAPGADLCVGAPGRVIEVKQGAPEHDCPDHDGGNDCVCGNASGVLPAAPNYAVVEFVLSNGQGKRLAMSQDKEGDSWVWACVDCEEPMTKDGEDWTWNGGRPAHKKCALSHGVKALERAGLRSPKKKTKKGSSGERPGRDR